MPNFFTNSGHLSCEVFQLLEESFRGKVTGFSGPLEMSFANLGNFVVAVDSHRKAFILLYLDVGGETGDVVKWGENEALAGMKDGVVFGMCIGA